MIKTYIRIFTIFCCSIFLITPQQSFAQNTPEEIFNFEEFSKLPIAHEGRIKPIQSFATSTLKDISGTDKITINAQTIDATQWLIISVFDPQNAGLLPIFKIENDAIRKALDLEKNTQRIALDTLSPYLKATQKDVIALLGKEQSALTKNEAALINIHENAATLTQLMRSFSALLPLDLVLPEQMRKDITAPITFLKIAPYEQGIKKALQKITSAKGNNPNTFSYDEMNTAQTGFQIAALRAGGEANTLFKVIPNSWDKNETDKQNLWLSPWQTILQGEGSPESAFLLSQWEELSNAYRNGNVALWNAVLGDLKAEMQVQAEGLYDPARFEAEKTYQSFKPYLWITLLYAISLALIIAGTRGALSSKKKVINNAAFFTAITGIALHLTAFFGRIYILERPALGTLYETLLFVSLACAIIGFALSRIKTPPNLFLGLGIFAALLLLTIAPIFTQSGESLEVLSAVLNTNFWLATHVLCITIGYGVCIMTALIAHAGFVAKIKNTGALPLQKLTHQFSIIALLLTAIGTILGGIWADQSWGRFWGWDPKENGALLIVLWLIWAQHGRLSGKITGLRFLAAMAALNIIVAISWFGVNLLGVGLHSYGFTSGILAGLIAFCALQTALIAMLWVKAHKSQTL